MKKFRDAIREELPFKSKKNGWPLLLWIEPSIHDGYADKEVRQMFNNSLQEVNNKHDEAIVVKLQQNWNEKDTNLFNERERRFTIAGLQSFWRAVDNAIMYGRQQSIEEPWQDPSRNLQTRMADPT